MEIVDRDRILRAVWGEIRRVKEQRGPVESLLKAIAEGYSFPTNLDKDPPPADEVSYGRRRIGKWSWTDGSIARRVSLTWLEKGSRRGGRMSSLVWPWMNTPRDIERERRIGCQIFP